MAEENNLISEIEGEHDQYAALREQFRQIVKQTIREGDYPHLRPTSHKRKPTCLNVDSRFRFNIFPSEEFIPCQGQRNFNFSPLEVVLCIYGTFNSPYKIGRGFVGNQTKYHRVGVGLNAVMDADQLMEDILQGLEEIKRGTYYALADGNYEHFARMVVPVVNDCIGQFKIGRAQELPYKFGEKQA